MSPAAIAASAAVIFLLGAGAGAGASTDDGAAPASRANAGPGDGTGPDPDHDAGVVSADSAGVGCDEIVERSHARHATRPSHHHTMPSLLAIRAQRQRRTRRRYVPLPRACEQATHTSTVPLVVAGTTLGEASGRPPRGSQRALLTHWALASGTNVKPLVEPGMCNFGRWERLSHVGTEATDHRLPTTDHRPPTADRRPPTTDHRPPTTDHRPPTTDHRPPTADHRPPNRPALPEWAVPFRCRLAINRARVPTGLLTRLEPLSRDPPTSPSPSTTTPAVNVELLVEVYDPPNRRCVTGSRSPRGRPRSPCGRRRCAGQRSRG